MVTTNTLANIDVNGSLITSPAESYAILKGKVFRVYDSQSINTNATLVYGFQTGIYPIYLKPAIIVSSADKLSVKFYKDSTWTIDSGVQLANNNLNHILNYSSACSCYRSVNVTSDGIEYAGVYIPWATGQGGTRSGEELKGEYEYILKPSTQYMFRISNGSSNTNIVSWSLVWFEDIAI